MAEGPSGIRLVVLSAPDPVAQGVGALWEGGTPVGEHVEGAAVHRLEPDLLVVRRAVRHVHDEGLDRRLPAALRELRPTLVFPSVHRSASRLRCFTVHPLGNPGGRADVGGRPRTLDPTDPRLMTAVLRELIGRAGTVGLPATYEATHHGPELGLPAFFVEVAVEPGGSPSEAEIAVLAEAIRSARPDPSDHVALAVGGGHYAPRFTDLVRSRRFAFGHILSRHALEDLEPATARSALEGTPGAEGILGARAQDHLHPALAGLGPSLREADAPRRDGASTSTSLPTSGT